ncbi:ParB N-terminal domain-containing protein [Brevibacillus sp. SYSU BS000544]|uniref:ParB N-terminal domain-containing protein n=1 Tax=Brevibacillus sp. SYSU BS000544 TaxID=3416443 RepID=UPI003CE4947A
MSEVLLSLKLIDIDKLYLHEEHEPSRLERTSQAIKHDGFLRHPVLVTEMKDGRYLVLDGVHRISALRLLGCAKVPVQIAQKSDFSIEAWHHLVRADASWRKLFQDSDLNWLQENEVTNQHGLIETVDEFGNRLFLDTVGQQDFLIIWHKLVTSYSKKGAVQRIPADSCLYPDKGTVLIKYKAVSFDQLEKVINEGRILPAGVTRFQVNGRLLNLKIPLELLYSEKSNEQEWEKLQLIWNQSLRLYTEQVYLCEI